MQLVAVGLNHETAPVEVRERVAIPAARFKEAVSALAEHVSHGIVFSTCNRTEVYALEDQASPAVPGIERFFCDYSGVAEAELLPRLFHKRQEQAVKHLFRVASGLESLIVGEYEVLGQLRHVLVELESIHSVDLLLLNLLRQAVRVGRRVRTETAISKNAASVSSAAVEVARKVFPDLARCGVLVIGAGEAGKLAVKALLNAHVSRVAVISRSLERASELAGSLGGIALPFHQLKEALSGTDIVVCCTGSPHFVLEPAAVGEASQCHNGSPLLIIDIAVPRDVDPGVRGFDNVMLYDIDDLEGVARTNRSLRQGEVAKASAIVDEEVSRFMAWWKSRLAMPVITSLLDKAEAIRAEQLERALKGMPVLSAEDRARLEVMSKSLVQKMLHGPISFVKANDSRDSIQMVRDMFGLDVTE
ncbi:MAG: glutamyl-tRNA reductase [Chloroflexota bacterium]